MAFNAIRRVLETIGEAASGKAPDPAHDQPLDNQDALGEPPAHFAEMYRSIAAFSEGKAGTFLDARAERDAGRVAHGTGDVMFAAENRSSRARVGDRELRIMSAAPYSALPAEKSMVSAATGANSARLFGAARKAMRESHSPYSQFPVGAAILSESGAVYSGCNIENAAFPEGWCAETSAIAHMVMAGDRQILEIAVVAEKMPKITPCGGCRQRILEFATADTLIHLCDESGVTESLTLDEILPRVF